MSNYVAGTDLYEANPSSMGEIGYYDRKMGMIQIVKKFGMNRYCLGLPAILVIILLISSSDLDSVSSPMNLRLE